MALIKNSFFKQVSLATLRKELKVEGVLELEFWEAEVNFSHNKSDFKFEVIKPEKNKMTKHFSPHKYDKDGVAYFQERYDKPTERRGNVKRFRTKADAEHYILFNIIQIYKPLKNYVDENNIVDKFNSLLDEHPEKFVTELEKGGSWLLN